MQQEKVKQSVVIIMNEEGLVIMFSFQFDESIEVLLDILKSLKGIVVGDHSEYILVYLST